MVQSIEIAGQCPWALILSETFGKITSEIPDELRYFGSPVTPTKIFQLFSSWLAGKRELSWGRARSRAKVHDWLDKRRNRGKFCSMFYRSLFFAPVSAGFLRQTCRLAAIGGCLIAMLSSSVVAQVSEADGFYKPTRVSGSVSAAGKTYQLPLGALRNALLTRGVVPIQDRRLRIHRGKWGEVLQNFGFLGIKGPTSVYGPDELVLSKTRKGYAGRTRVPLEVRMNGRYRWVPVTMTLSTRLDSKVIGDRFVMNAPIRIKVIGITLDGSIQMEAKRLERPYPF